MHWAGPQSSARRSLFTVAVWPFFLILSFTSSYNSMRSCCSEAVKYDAHLVSMVISVILWSILWSIWECRAHALIPAIFTWLDLASPVQPGLAKVQPINPRCADQAGQAPLALGILDMFILLLCNSPLIFNLRHYAKEIFFRIFFNKVALRYHSDHIPFLNTPQGSKE